MLPKSYNVLGFVLDCCGHAHLTRAPTISPHLTGLQLNIIAVSGNKGYVFQACTVFFFFCVSMIEMKALNLGGVLLIQ